MTQLPLRFSDSPGVNGEMVDMELRVIRHREEVMPVEWFKQTGLTSLALALSKLLKLPICL